MKNSIKDYDKDGYLLLETNFDSRGFNFKYIFYVLNSLYLPIMDVN